MKPMNHMKPWTANDDALLMSMIPHDIPTAKIAEHLGRTPATIQWRIWWLRSHKKLDVTTATDTKQTTLWTENKPVEALPDQADDDSFMNAEMPAEMPFLDGVRGRPLPQPTAIIRRSILWGLIRWTRFIYDHENDK